LRMAEAGAAERGDDVEHLVHVEVATGAVALAQYRRDRAVPAFEHLALARVVRVEIDAALGATDGRSRDRELELHRLREVRHLACGHARAHARTATCGTTVQRVDHEPRACAGLAIVP